jgi:hypothetical protein
MIKNRWLLAFCGWWFGMVAGVQAQTAYNYTITTTPATYKAIQPAVADLQVHLSKALNHPFKVLKTDSVPAVGIVLVKAPLADSLKYEGLDFRSSESFLLLSNGKAQLHIVSFTKQGLMHGIYTYLDKLGFKWYQPGDEYATIPALKDIRLKVNEVQAPHMLLRTFFGTFGTSRNSVLDKTKQVDKNWAMWEMRNRMGGSYNLKGHAWNPFLWRHVSELQQHPEYMALVKGARVKVGTAAKFCISNAGFRKLFVDDMLKQLQQQIDKSPGASKYIISVEPSDGDGFCTCDECKKLGSVSNAVFMLANETAKAFSAVSAVAYVNLYAYNKHAAPPAFQLQPNVIVQLIPYKYQSYAKPDDMIKAWQAKTTNLFMYDYYGLPLTNLDMPLKVSPEGYAGRIKYWYAQGIKGVRLESSYSTQATGLGLYLFARLGWSKEENVNAVVADYYRQCYGPAAETIGQSKQVLADGKVSSAEALAGAAALLKNLKPPADSVQARNVTNYKAYLHYLHLLYAFKASKNTNAAADELMQFVSGTWHRMVIHPFAVYHYLQNRSKAKAYMQANWNYLKVADKCAKFKTVVQLSDEAIEKLFGAQQLNTGKADVEFEE